MKTELILTDDEINRIANKLEEIIDKKNNLNVSILKYGLIREFAGMDLWFEKLTDTLDGFVLRDKNNGSVLGIFPEQE
ncbi:MAG: hypothetical protein K0S18_106 [Anaerocolumna sp.]|jgi:hypothetical protein|nr:hypothetical protein [Anaerocolumna sp.]